MPALNGPSALAVNAAGTLLVADTLNNAVRLLQLSGSGITVNAVTNGATNLSGPVSPGEVVVIYGSGLGRSAHHLQPDANGSRAHHAVAGTSVYFNGAPAPVLYASSSQVAAVVPYGISGSLAQMYVQYQNVTSAPFNALGGHRQIPAIFTLNGSGSGQAAAINNKDGSINGAAAPPRPAITFQLYITGVGQTSPPAPMASERSAPAAAGRSSEGDHRRTRRDREFRRRRPGLCRRSHPGQRADSFGNHGRRRRPRGGPGRHLELPARRHDRRRQLAGTDQL